MTEHPIILKKGFITLEDIEGDLFLSMRWSDNEYVAHTEEWILEKKDLENIRYLIEQYFKLY